MRTRTPTRRETAFLQFAMGDGGAEARVPTDYTLIENGEREALLMYAARRIKFDLTPTIAGRNQVCLLYSRAEQMSGCTVERPGANPAEVFINYLYEGMNRVSYTGHEFWMMFNIATYRDKAFFTIGNQMANGNLVDTFIAWDNANVATVPWHDNNGVQTTYPGAPYRFQGIYDANNNSRDFFQHLLGEFLRTYNPRIVIYGQF